MHFAGPHHTKEINYKLTIKMKECVMIIYYSIKNYNKYINLKQNIYCTVFIGQEFEQSSVLSLRISHRAAITFSARSGDLPEGLMEEMAVS